MGVPVYTPVGWVDNATDLSASNFQHMEQGILDAIAGLGSAKGLFRAYLSASPYSLGDGGTIVFDNVGHSPFTPDMPGYNPDGWYSNTTGRFTPQRRGFYAIHAAMSIASGMSSGQYVEIRLFRSGTLWTIGSRGYWSGTSTQANSHVHDHIYFNGTTDYVHCTHAASTARTDTLDSQPWSTFFTASYVGDG